MTNRRQLGALLVATAALLPACSPLTVSEADERGATPSPAQSAPTSPGEAGRHLKELTVASSGSMAGYNRDKFLHWSGQGDNCDTREAVLKRDGEDVKTGNDCYPTSGSWTSPYDGETWTNPSDVDIDHMVPLANSWISGASEWTNDEREAFANDLKGKQLLAVTDNLNQSKSDRSPDEWKPPLESYHCQYATDWISVKHQYKLTVTKAEKTALKDMISTC